MDKSMLQEYRARWQAVAAVEKREQQSASFTQRWQQLNAIIGLAAALKLRSTVESDEVEAVRQRWSKLKRIAEGD